MRYAAHTLGLALLVLTSAAAEAATLKETFTRTSALGPGGTVAVENVNGNVVVEAWDRAEVQVQAEKRVETKNQDLARKVMGQIRIDVKANGNSFRIKTLMPRNESGLLDWLTGNEYNASVRYHVRVPRQVAVEVENANGGIKLVGTRGRAVLITVNGGLTLDRTAGQVRLATTNGGITVTGASGTVDAETTNGGIQVELTQIPDGSDLSFATVNGGIELRLPRDIQVSLDAATSNGAVRTDFEVEGGGAASRRTLRGDINGGGGKLQVRTTNGSVRLLAI